MQKIISIGVLVSMLLVGGWLFITQGENASVQENENIQQQEETVESTASGEIDDTSPASATTEISVETEKETPSEIAQIREFIVEGSNFKFLPSSMNVNKGDTVKIVFKNSGGSHDLRIDAFNTATKVIASGEEETITFVADTVGTFEYYCSVGSHRTMRMKGTLIVK